MRFFGLTVPEAFTIVQAIAMLAVTVIVWSLRAAYASGSSVSSLQNRARTTEEAIAAHARRLSDVESKIAQIESDYAALPLRWRSDCLTLREADQRFEESARDRNRIDKGQDELWQAVNDLRRRA